MNIEESIQQMGTLIEAWELDEAELNQTDINAMQVLLKEIQELKLELSGYRQAILEDKDMLGLKEESEELKKQLEEYKATNKVLSQELTKDKVLQQDHLTTCCGIPIGDIPKLITQQKEFINFLEDNYKETQDIWYIKILQKYKEIIGGDKK